MGFIEAPEFSKAIQRFSDEDYAHFQNNLSQRPLQGDVMRGCGGFRKARMAFPSAGIGKSGGARVIYLHVPDNNTIYLIQIYGKSSKGNLSKSEQNTLREIANKIRNSRSP